MTSFWFAAVIILIMVGISDLFTSVYLHRGKTHRTVKFHWLAEMVMRLWLWSLIGQVVKNWVAVHRKHHQFPDKPGDPHSPHLLGFWKVWFGNVIFYAKTLSSDPKITERYAPDIPSHKILDKDWLGYLCGLVIFSCIVGLWLGFSIWTPIIGLTAHVSHLLIYFMTLSVINGVCHKFGYQNFREEGNLATNFPWFFCWLAIFAVISGLWLGFSIWTILIGVAAFVFLVTGEVWHNNHHHDPFSPKIGYRWWEIDFGWVLIKMLILFGLAKQECPTINEKERLERAPESPQ